MTSVSGRRSQSSMRTGTGSDFYEPPTAQEIMEHGRYLGLDPVYDAHLMWIAEESLCAPLPAFWEDHVDEQGNVYYRNRRTGQTSRYHPLDKKYKKKVLQAKMGDLQSKLGEIDPDRGGERSTVAEQPAGLQQQYYQKILPTNLPGGGPQPMRGSAPSATSRSSSSKGENMGFFSKLRRLGRRDKDTSAGAGNDELTQTMQLIEKVEQRVQVRHQGGGGPAVAQGAGAGARAAMGSGGAGLGGASAAQMPPGPGHFDGVAPRAGAGRGDAGPVRKSRSRASFQLQSSAPQAKPAGLPADPHDGGPHEDVKDMATYLRLDPQRDYRFMWVSQLAMSEPVPHNWKEMYDEQGYPYYVNQVNGKTSRRHPSDAFYNQLVKYEKIRELTEGPRPEIGAWMDFTDFDGSTYYYNFEINMSSSHRPHFGLQNKRLIDRLKLEATIELEHYVATKIQSMWRRHLVKKIVRNRKNQVDAAITIQRAFRRYINRDLDKRRKMAEIHSARRIQAHYRGRMARRQVKEMANSKHQHVAATKIQARFRGRKARRILIEPHVRRIQANWRGYMTRKIILPLMQDRKLFASVVRVQTAWRAKAERTSIARKYADQKRKWAAKKVQAHWRGFVTRVEYEKMLEDEFDDRAKVNADKKKRQLETIRNRAAVTIQCSWKAYKSRSFLKTIKAVLTLQRQRRQKIQVDDARSTLNGLRKEHQLRAAMNMQRFWRGHCSRRWMRQQKTRAVAAILRQASHRRDVKRNLFRAQQAAATLIANKARQRIAKQRLAVMKSSLKLQALYRGCRARRLLRQLQAAVLLQALCRMKAARDEATQRRQVGAIVVIQKCGRGMAGRERTKAARRRVWAATTVQRMGRGMLARERVKHVRLGRAARHIQRAWRGKAVRMRYFQLLTEYWERQHEAREHQAATTLQARWRGRLARAEVLPRLEAHRLQQAREAEQHGQVRVLQALLRMRAERRAYLRRREDGKRDRAAVHIQKWWRGVLAKRVVELAREAREWQFKSDAAVMIQKHWRRHSCVEKYKATIKKRNASILYMQSLWRMKQARMERQRRTLFNVAVRLQARYRGKVARRRADTVRREQELEKRCALILQACCRSFMEMVTYDELRLRVAAAVAIQALWRGYAAGVRFRRDRARHYAQQQAAAVLQAVCRTHGDRRDFRGAVRRLRELRAAVRIQAAWRAKMTRRWFVQEAERLREEYRQKVIHKMVASYAHKIEVIEAAALHVQRRFRGLAARKRVLKARRRKAAIHIQRNVRGFLCRRRTLGRLSVRFDWMLVSSLVLDPGAAAVAPGADQGLRCLREYAEHMLAPWFSPHVRRFKWLCAIKALSAGLIQKIARGKSGRRRAVDCVRDRVEALRFGPELRRLRSSLNDELSASSRCLRKMRRIIMRKHDLEAAKYVQRCYRGRLGRRLMKVLRGHSNMNRIRRVMMPIVLRANTATSRTRPHSGEENAWPTQPSSAAALLHPRAASADGLRAGSSLVDRRRGRSRSTRDVLVQPRNSMISLRTMVSKFAVENQIELPEHLRGDDTTLPPIKSAQPAVRQVPSTQSQDMSGLGIMRRPGMAWA